MLGSKLLVQSGEWNEVDDGELTSIRPGARPRPSLAPHERMTVSMRPLGPARASAANADPLAIPRAPRVPNLGALAPLVPPIASEPSVASEPTSPPASELVHPKPDERRDHARAHLEADVSLYSPTHFWTGFSEDLSEGGLFVATYQHVPIGTEIDLEFELPTGYAVKTIGVVRWVREGDDDTMPGVGVQFLRLTDEDQRVIRSFLKHRAPMLFDTDDD